MLFRWVEFLCLFWIIPICLFAFREPLAPLIIPFIICVALLCSLILWRDDKLQKQWQRAKLLQRKHFRPMWQSFLALAILTIIFVYFYTPNTLFDLPLNHTYSWLVLIVAYPLLSVVPQEVIFRIYFFHRFKKLFSSKLTCAWLSSICFGFAHIIYSNWIAVIFSFMGGLLFSFRFVQTKSIALVIVEHSLWGVFLFTIGLGSFFIATPT
ncbi:CPBP family intramembrane glutamic endopeptidase [Thalassotalea fusca]